MPQRDHLPPGWYRCVGGPFDGRALLPGDDIPEGGIVRPSFVGPLGWGDVGRGPAGGHYVRRGDRLVWRASR